MRKPFRIKAKKLRNKITSRNLIVSTIFSTRKPSATTTQLQNKISLRLSKFKNSTVPILKILIILRTPSSPKEISLLFHNLNKSYSSKHNIHAKYLNTIKPFSCSTRKFSSLPSNSTSKSFTKFMKEKSCSWNLK